MKKGKRFYLRLADNIASLASRTNAEMTLGDNHQQIDIVVDSQNLVLHRKLVLDLSPLRCLYDTKASLERLIKTFLKRNGVTLTYQNGDRPPNRAERRHSVSYSRGSHA